MRMIFVFAPLMMLGVAWLIGYARFTRAFITYAALLLTSMALIATSLFPVTEPSVGRFLLGITCLALAIPVAVLVGMTGRRDPAPIVVAAEAYDGMTPDQKANLRRGASIVAKFAAKHLGSRLRDKGYVRTADAMRDGARFL